MKGHQYTLQQEPSAIGRCRVHPVLPHAKLQWDRAGIPVILFGMNVRILKARCHTCCIGAVTLAFRHPEGSSAEAQLDAGRDLFVEPWWAGKLGTGSAEWWLGALDGGKLSELPGKQRVGLVNALVDLLRHLVGNKPSRFPRSLS